MEFDSEHSEQEWFVQPQRREPSRIHRRMQSTTNQICGICCLFVMVAPLVVGLAVAAMYDASASSCGNTAFIIDLDMWLYVACGIPLIVSLFYLFVGLYQMFTSPELYLRITECYRSKWHVIFFLTNTLFWCTWGVIGLYIYTQMTMDCSVTAIGSMILIIAVLELLNGCCVACIVYGALAYYNRLQRTVEVQHNPGQFQQEQEIERHLTDDDKQFKPFQGAGHHIDL